MARVAPHEQLGIAIGAVVLASRVAIDAIVVDLGLVEDALGLDLFDYQHKFPY
jgi:hypothetical protein